jgi:hypothetical protein
MASIALDDRDNKSIITMPTRCGFDYAGRILKEQQFLPFISNEDLYKHTETVVQAFRSKIQQADRQLYKNVIDPFSAVFNCFVQGIAPSDWLELEKARQIQKTLEDSLGYFHQNVLTSMPGWRKIDLTDIVNEDLGIVAELKNKYNTTKGVHKVKIYEDLSNRLGHRGYEDFTGYYVEIIPRTPRPYNVPFTPPDNQTGIRKAKNDRIRKIDGKSFYDKASGHEGALRMLYQTLPKVVSEILGKSNIGYIREPNVGYIREESASYIRGLIDVFDRAYGAGNVKAI